MNGKHATHGKEAARLLGFFSLYLHVFQGILWHQTSECHSRPAAS